MYSQQVEICIAYVQYIESLHGRIRIYWTSGHKCRLCVPFPFPPPEREPGFKAI